MVRVGNLVMVSLGLLLLVASPTLAQTQTGSILVRVVDEQGGVLPGVSITISSPVLIAGTMSGVTDSGGVYRFPSLTPGLYSVTFGLEGFQTLVRQGIVVSVGQTTPLEMALKVASIAQEVTVVGASPTVDTTTATVSVTLTQELLQSTPGGHDIWSLMEYKVPGLVTSRPDVGGAAGGLNASYSARGTANTQNVQFLNGANVGDTTAIGFSAAGYYDYESFDEVQVSTGANDLSVPWSGVFLNMITKSGGDRFSARTSYSYEGESTQFTNVDDRLLNAGLRKDAGSVRFVSDANVQAGGPVIKNKLRFFGSFRDWRLHLNVPGFPEVEETKITSFLGNLTWQVNNNNKITAFASEQQYFKPNRNASALNNPTSTAREDDPNDIRQLLWNSVLSGNAFMNAHLSYAYIMLGRPQKGHDQSLTDQATGYLDRAIDLESYQFKPRWEFNANFQYFLDQALGGRHELRFGFDHGYMPTKIDNYRIDDLNVFWNSATGQATQVTLFNSPLTSQTNAANTAVFAQDTYIVKRLSIAGGVRWERFEGYLPEQSSPASQWFPSLPRNFAEVRNIVNFKDMVPRISVAYDVFGNGKTAVKAAAGRYSYNISTNLANTVNGNFQTSETYVWNDVNRDLRFQAGESGSLLSRSSALTATISPDLRRPYTDELTATVDRELMPNLRLSVGVNYRWEKDNFGNLDNAVPFSAYSPVVRPDPGPDGIAGNADDNPDFVVYNQDPATLGQNRIVVSNSPLFNQKYKGLEITASKRMSNRWQMLAGYSLSSAIINADPPSGSGILSPNTLINSNGPVSFDRTHMFKFTGSYLLPRDVEVSGNFRTQTGVPLTRTVQFRLNQGNVTVNAEPRGNTRLDYLTTLDLRLSKKIRIGRQRIEGMIDFYNLTNANTTYNARPLTGRVTVNQGGEPTGAPIVQQQFLLPLAILNPRLIRFGLSYSF